MDTVLSDSAIPRRRAGAEKENKEYGIQSETVNDQNRMRVLPPMKRQTFHGLLVISFVAIWHSGEMVWKSKVAFILFSRHTFGRKLKRVP